MPRWIPGKLSEKQMKFIECFAGNATEAARLAGYKGNDNTLKSIGNENLRKPDIIAAIHARQAESLKPSILTRDQRQAFWSTVVTNSDETMQNRLKASELLGRSNADFTEKVLTGDLESELKEMSDDELERKLEMVKKQRQALRLVPKAA